MKALVLNEVKSPLSFQDVDAPEPPPGHVVVNLKAASLNRRDYWITQGLYPGIDPPVILGSDGAGVVRQVAEGVDPAWTGREVILDPGSHWGDNDAAQANDFTILGLPQDGTFAQQVVVSADQLHAKPDHLDWEQAAAIPLAGVTAYRAVCTQGQVQHDDRVLITGIGGGVATFALQFALAKGAEVWVTSSSEEKVNRAIALGAKGGFDYRQDNWWKVMAKEAGNPDLIIDSAGGRGYAALVNVAAPGGRIVNYGATAGPPEKFDLFKVFWKQLTVKGSTMGSPSDFRQMLNIVGERKIEPIIDSAVPLSEGPQAVEQMAKSPQFGKCVLRIE